MRSLICSGAMIGLLIASAGCSKKTQYGDVSATIMKSKTVAATLVADEEASLTADQGSMVQSFTPTSLKLPIFKVNLCQGSSGCQSIYNCSANTVEGCLVELSNIEAFVNAINSSPQQIEDGTTWDHIGVEFCSEGNRDGIQNVTLNGTVKIQGTDYATDPSAGLVAGTSGKDVQIKVPGGCGSFYKLKSAFTVSKDSPITAKLFFDASLYASGGVAGGASNTNTYNNNGSCVGSASAYVCVPVITVVATVDSGTPAVEHYLVANTGTAGESPDNAPTASVSIYYSSAGEPIGGIQNDYRLSGSTVTWGTRMDGGLGLYPKVVDADTISFGEPEGSVSLANWFKNFKRSSHTGTYTYAMSGAEKTGSYKATKF